MVGGAQCVDAPVQARGSRYRPDPGAPTFSLLFHCHRATVRAPCAAFGRPNRSGRKCAGCPGPRGTSQRRLLPPVRARHWASCTGAHRVAPVQPPDTSGVRRYGGRHRVSTGVQSVGTPVPRSFSPPTRFPKPEDATRAKLVERIRAFGSLRARHPSSPTPEGFHANHLR